MPAAIESINLGFLLDGKWRNDGERIEVLSPGTRQRVGVTYRATSADAEAAIRAAVRAFETTRRMGGYERQRVLRAISSGIEKQSDELARMVAQEAGKPIKTARVEVDRAIFTFSVAAEEAVRVGGEYLPLDWQASTAGRWGIVRRFPLGPIAAITPFNFPINLVAHKVAPAIAAGCTIVLKPAPQTPLTALRLAQIIEQAGWPAGALNVLPLSNEDASILVSDDRLKLLSFTGSTAVGWALKQKAGKKKVVLELGGNAGVVICADANLEYAADRCVIGGFGYAGQSCISVQRILVEDCVYDKFLSAARGGLDRASCSRRSQNCLRRPSQWTDGHTDGPDQYKARHARELHGDLRSRSDSGKVFSLRRIAERPESFRIRFASGRLHARFQAHHASVRDS